MSNNKQSMKLYTEEQVKMAIQMADKYNYLITSEECDIVNSLTPIELPSDEEIIKIMELDDMEFDEFDPYHLAHLEGAKWMRDKIQGGNNEQR
jgi:hypothetical protein